MSITLLYGCGQIETAVADLASNRAFMTEVLGGGEIEQRMAREITALFPGGGHVLEHYDIGEGVFQVNAPSAEGTVMGRKTIHQVELERVGSCVTNLYWHVDDVAHARDLLVEMGAEIRTQGPSTLIACLSDYGSNTRPGGEGRPFIFMGARSLIGLDLELMEPNFERVTRQSVQYPSFLHPRPKAGTGELRLSCMRLVARDLEETLGNLTRLIAPASRSKPYEVHADPHERRFRIGLGGLELEYRQPISSRAQAAALLDRYGSGVTAIVFDARDPAAVAKRAEAAGCEVEKTDGGYAIASRSVVGFDVVLEPWVENPFAR